MKGAKISLTEMLPCFSLQVIKVLIGDAVYLVDFPLLKVGIFFFFFFIHSASFLNACSHAQNLKHT